RLLHRSAARLPGAAARRAAGGAGAAARGGAQPRHRGAGGGYDLRHRRARGGAALRLLPRVGARAAAGAGGGGDRGIRRGGGAGGRVFPEGSDPAAARFRVLVDPIDGTRGLMYNKRSAWSLAAAAPNRGEATCLADVEVAVQTELPTTRACLSDQLWAARGEGAHGETHHLITGARDGFRPRPSGATSLAHGFSAISKFFPGGKALAARLEEALFEELL